MTISTSGISKPLAATSVAIRIVFSLALKLLRLYIHFTYDIWPFIGIESRLMFLHIILSMMLYLQVWTNIIVCYLTL